MAPPAPEALRVTVSGGGPVGLAFALLLDDLMGPRAEIVVYDGRWAPADDGGVAWKGRAADQPPPAGGDAAEPPVGEAARRRSGAALRRRRPHRDVADGPHSVDDLPPRNVRISYIEDQLLALANEAERIRLGARAVRPGRPDDLAGPARARRLRGQPVAHP